MNVPIINVPIEPVLALVIGILILLVPSFSEPMLKVGQISAVERFVDSRQAATRAVELARSAKGVKSVKDSLVVK